MGYRSDVAYTIRFTDDHDTNNEQSFYTFLAEAKSNPKCQIALAEVEIDHKNRAFYYSARDVKWYENYDHMKEVANARANFNETFNCDEEDTRYAWEMLRIGEEDNDIETDRSDYNDYLLYVSRQIRIDMAGVD